ncbi:MAG: hypothetical protein P8Y01_00340 [Woeseiaceae bacterium]
MKSERLRRKDPARTEPNRNWGQLFRQPSADSAFGTDPSGANGASSDDKSVNEAVSEAVDLGYKIIEEQISHGKRVAEQVSTRNYTSNSVGDDASEVVRRLLQFYTDFGSICFDMIETFSRSSIFSESVQNLMNRESAVADGAGDKPVSGSAGFSCLPLDVQSTRPARVELDLDGLSKGCSLGVHALYALDPDKPALRDIAFLYDDHSARPTLKIRVPADQPTDVYTGVVIDTATNLARGTISIRIGDVTPDSR